MKTAQTQCKDVNLGHGFQKSSEKYRFCCSRRMYDIFLFAEIHVRRLSDTFLCSNLLEFCANWILVLPTLIFNYQIRILHTVSADSRCFCCSRRTYGIFLFPEIHIRRLPDIFLRSKSLEFCEKVIFSATNINFELQNQDSTHSSPFEMFF